ncbi:MAG: hypothetical protein V1746_00515 [bacterium]
MISKGYVGLFSEPFTEKHIRQCVASWLKRFEKVEQVCGDRGAVTLEIKATDDILMKETHQQFRVLVGMDFAWIYLTKDHHIMETTGLPSENISLCLDVLLDLPGLKEIIDQKNDSRLDQLEKEGLM